MRAIDADNLARVFAKKPRGLWATNLILKDIEIEPTVDLQPVKDSHHDLIMRIVREALCARERQHISVDGDGNVTVFPMTEMARLVAEENRERHWHCSKCGNVYGMTAMAFKYCPMCGAEFVKDGDGDAS